MAFSNFPSLCQLLARMVILYSKIEKENEVKSHLERGRYHFELISSFIVLDRHDYTNGTIIDIYPSELFSDFTRGTSQKICAKEREGGRWEQQAIAWGGNALGCPYEDDVPLGMKQ